MFIPRLIVITRRVPKGGDNTLQVMLVLHPDVSLNGCDASRLLLIGRSCACQHAPPIAIVPCAQAPCEPPFPVGPDTDPAPSATAEWARNTLTRQAVPACAAGDCWFIQPGTAISRNRNGFKDFVMRKVTLSPAMH